MIAPKILQYYFSNKYTSTFSYLRIIYVVFLIFQKAFFLKYLFHASKLNHRKTNEKIIHRKTNKIAMRCIKQLLI